MIFRDLTENDIEIRVGQCGENNGKGWATLLLYKNARVDMNILDEAVGNSNWQRKHYDCKGNLFCSVGININFDKDKEPYWIWKDDCGVESFSDKEKGEASDSFKRACFNWGIGRELYTIGAILVNIEVKKNKKDKIVPNGIFSIEKIKIENKEIVGLAIKFNDKRVYTYVKNKGE